MMFKSLALSIAFIVGSASIAESVSAQNGATDCPMGASVSRLMQEREFLAERARLAAWVGGDARMAEAMRLQQRIFELDQRIANEYRTQWINYFILTDDPSCALAIVSRDYGVTFTAARNGTSWRVYSNGQVLRHFMSKDELVAFLRRGSF